MILLLFYLALALFVSFLCSIAEAVILSVTEPFVRMKEKEGKSTVKYLKSLKSNIDRPLSAILSINTVAHTIGAAGVGAQAVQIFGEVYFGVISATLTILILFFSEIIPKTIGAIYWRKLALPSAILIIGMVYVSYPLVVISELITRLISKKKNSQTVTREEVVAIAHLGQKDGALEESESKIIDNVIKLNSLKIKDIMTPRTVVVSAPEDMTLDVFFQHPEYLQYSRIPVYADSIDNVTGYVLKSDVLESLANDKHDLKLKNLKRPIIIVFENLSVPKLLEELLHRKEHIALIIDEYGGMQGLATMEDVIEAILGAEIIDEKDSVADLQELARKKWEIRRGKIK